MRQQRIILFLLTVLMLTLAIPAIGQGTPSILITNPLDGEVVSTVNGVDVQGTSSLVEGQTIVVAIQDQEGENILEMDTAADFNGGWFINMNTDLLDMQGRIYAYIPSPGGGAPLVDATIHVTFVSSGSGQTVPPSILITNPVENATVNTDGGVTVSGVSAGLGGNQVRVQLQDANGGILSEQGTTPSSNGNWSVSLNPGAVNARGRIFAYSPSPQGGNLADATIFVTYVTTPQPPSILITDPPNGGFVNTDQGVRVTGTSSNLFEGNVVVRLQDVNGGTLAEQATVASANGTWSVNLYPSPLNASGRIFAFSPSPGGGNSADATINVTFTSNSHPRPPFINITNPVNGAVLDTNGSFEVSGRAGNLFEGNVVIRALGARGAVLAEQATTVDGFGNWTVVLNVGKQNQQGAIQAFSPSAQDGSIVVEDRVNVTYVSTPDPPPPPPFIQINQPSNGAVINSERGIAVNGIAGNLPQNSIMVRLRDANGGTISQQATVADQFGNWGVTFHIGAINTPGSIYVFSTSPANNSVVADDLVNVTFIPTVTPVPTPPAPPSLHISSPVNGAFVNTTNGFNVFGTAANLPENNIIVRVRDSFGRTLRETVATADRFGNWAANFNFIIANQTAGTIYAFSTSPRDGSVVADSLVNVTFASNCTVRTDWPIYTVQSGDSLYKIAQKTGSTVAELTTANCLTNPNIIFRGQPIHVPRLPAPPVTPQPEPEPEVVITSPNPQTVLNIDDTVLVRGSAQDIPQESVFVRALDNEGNVLAEARASIVAVSGNNWTWLVNLPIVRVLPGTRGTIFAYSASPEDGSIVVSSAVNVIYGVDLNTSYVTINQPLPYAQVPNNGNVRVSGTGAGLFEGNVVVRATDAQGRFIAEVPTVLNTNQVGGAGDWSVDLPINTGPGTRGIITAFSTSPEDGSVNTLFSVDVTFGDPAGNSSFAWITTPLPNTVVTDDTRILSIAGYVGGVFTNSVTLQLNDERGVILLAQPLTVEPDTGFWTATVDVSGGQEITLSQAIRVLIFATSPSDGTVLASDDVTIFTRGEETVATISGTVTTSQPTIFPPNAVMSVQLLEVSPTDAQATVVTEQFIALRDVQAPVPYELEYDPSLIDPRNIYVLRASVRANGQLIFTTTAAYPVITYGNPSDNVDIVMQRA